MVGHAGWVRLFSYVVASDSGFAPNPFWGVCTLATCKPAIRRTARVGDWVAGLSPRASGNRLVYAMRVAEVMPIDSYFADPRFEAKKPDPSGGRSSVEGGQHLRPRSGARASSASCRRCTPGSTVVRTWLMRDVTWVG